MPRSNVKLHRGGHHWKGVVNDKSIVDHLERMQNAIDQSLQMSYGLLTPDEFERLISELEELHSTIKL